MKLKPGFIFHDIDQEHLVVATGEASRHFNGLIRNNATADVIYRLLEQETTEEAIVDALYERYQAPREQIRQDVHALLEQMRAAGILDE